MRNLKIPKGGNKKKNRQYNNYQTKGQTMI